jgi:hypothetical protein
MAGNLRWKTRWYVEEVVLKGGSGSRRRKRRCGPDEYPSIRVPHGTQRSFRPLKEEKNIYKKSVQKANKSKFQRGSHFTVPLGVECNFSHRTQLSHTQTQPFATPQTLYTRERKATKGPCMSRASREVSKNSITALEKASLS